MAGKENESNRLFEDEKVIEIEIERLRSFKDHPFKVEDDKDMHLPVYFPHFLHLQPAVFLK